MTFDNPPTTTNASTGNGTDARMSRSSTDQNQKSVLFVTRSPEFGGAERHLFDLMRRLSRSGTKLSIVCLDSDRYAERLSRDPDMYAVVNCNREIRSAWEWFRFFRSTRPDIVVLIRSWTWCFPWYVSFVAWLAGISRRFSIMHLPPTLPPRSEASLTAGLWQRLRGTRYSLSHRRLALFCTTTICVSDAIRDILVRDCLFSAKSTITICNGVALLKFAPNEPDRLAVRMSAGLMPDEFVVVCIARLSQQKRIDILLDAIKRVIQRGVDCKCILVGDGPLREQLFEQALALGVSAHIVFEGFREDVRPYLHAADIFILTSDTEGMPLTILEAMACGLPCIVTNVGGNAEAVTHGIDGLVVPMGSADAVADAIAYLAIHPNERGQMSKMARARVCEAFDLEKTMTQIEEVILR